MTPTLIETERLAIMPFSSGDWRDFLELSGDPEVVRHIGSGETWTEEQTRDWTARQVGLQRERGFSRYKLVFRRTDELAGFCGAASFGTTGEEEIGWWIRRSLWGRGLASEAALAVKTYLLETVGLPGLISVCTPENRASIRIMEKIGLVFRKQCLATDLGLTYRDLEVVVYETP